MFFESLVALITFSLLGFVKIPKKKDKTIKDELLFKNLLFPQIVLSSIFIMILTNVIFFKEPFNYIGLLLVFIFLLVLIKLMKFMVLKISDLNL
jgi:hypothetical protein